MFIISSTAVNQAAHKNTDFSTLPGRGIKPRTSTHQHNHFLHYSRYGDALNPWGDLIAMARAWCVIPPGSKALVGVPSGPDRIHYNSARLYGPLLYSHLFANWKVLASDVDMEKFSDNCYHCYQPITIIERKN